MPANELLIRLGKAIRTRRENLKVTQEAFAEAHGINVAHYGSIERGTQNVTLLNLFRIASAFEVSVSQILKEAEKLSADPASFKHTNPPRRGRPPGSKSSWRHS